MMCLFHHHRTRDAPKHIRIFLVGESLFFFSSFFPFFLNFCFRFCFETHFTKLPSLALNMGSSCLSLPCPVPLLCSCFLLPGMPLPHSLPGRLVVLQESDQTLPPLGAFLNPHYPECSPGSPNPYHPSDGELQRLCAMPFSNLTAQIQQARLAVGAEQMLL